MLNLHTLICNLLPVRQNKVVLYAVAERYGDNMRYVGEELQRRSSCDIVWVSEKNKVETPKGIRSVCGRYAMSWELSTAHVIVADGRIAQYWNGGFVKKPGQIYIHARYGSFGIAKEEADVHESSGMSIVRNVSIDSKNLDYLVSNCTWHTDCYHFNYQFSKDCLQFGNPRNDVLVTPDRSGAISLLHKRYSIPEGARIAVYAPARRPWLEVSFPELDYDGVLATLRKRFGGEWVLLIRRHPLLSEKTKHWLVPEDNPSIYDAWDYPDTAELLAAADVMIGDYSSCTYDFLLTSRPVFLYIPDAEDFEKHIGFYDQPTSTPIPCASNNAALLEAIEVFDSKSFTINVSDYLRKQGNADDGHATARICDLILRKVHESIPSMDATRRQIFRDTLCHAERVGSKRHLYLLGFKIWSYTPLPVNKWQTEPIQKNKIVFYVENWMSYSGSCKYIAEEIIRRKLPYDLVWLVSPYILHFIKDIPKQIRLIITGTPASYYEYATAKLWIDENLRNNYISKWGKKRRGQIRLNTWHTSLDLVKEIRRRQDTLIQWRQQEKWAASVDYVVSSCAWESKIRKKIFPKCKRILQFGNPRNDLIIKGDHAQIRCSICEKLGIPLDRKIALFTSPRFIKLRWSNLDQQGVLRALEYRMGSKWVLVAKNHYDPIESHAKQPKFDGSLVEIDDFVDVQKLLIASDILISDYSTCIMDFLLLRKPIFLYIPDKQKIEGYVELHYSLENTPFPIARSNAELIKNIEQFDAPTYIRSCEQFCSRMEYKEDGNAAKRVVDYIQQIAPPV